MGQASYYYGLNNLFTGYTGIQFTDNNYLAGLLGVGINTSIGAFAVDVTHSRAEIPDDKTYQGQSYRVTWNKLSRIPGHHLTSRRTAIPPRITWACMMR